MKTLIISTEGQSEDHFVKVVLGPHLMNYGLYAKSIILGNAARKGNGGFNSYGQIENEVRKLNEIYGQKSFITTMFDFSDLRKDYPEIETIKLIPNSYEKVKKAEEILMSVCPVPTFIPHFQLHQFETLIFSSPIVLLKQFPSQEDAIRELIEQRNFYANSNPELVNSTNKPSYRIAEALKVNMASFKGIVIANLVSEIGLPILRSSCLHFNNWLLKLESLVK